MRLFFNQELRRTTIALATVVSRTAMAGPEIAGYFDPR